MFSLSTISHWLSTKHSPKRRRTSRVLGFEMLETRAMFSAGGFGMSSLADALINAPENATAASPKGEAHATETMIVGSLAPTSDGPTGRAHADHTPLETGRGFPVAREAARPTPSLETIGTREHFSDFQGAHVYGHEDVSLSHVMVKAVYLLPSDRAPSNNWQADMMNILPRLEAFHETQFGGLSEVSFALHGPVVGNRTTSGYRALGDGFYYDMVTQVRELDRAGALGTPVGSSPAADPSAGPPTATMYLIFADWGQFDVDSVNSHQWLNQEGYFVGLNSPTGTDLNDIDQAGGSRGKYWGTDNTLGPYGAGIVTEEGWKHPEIPGTAIVAYHEGLGHSLGMPHPSPEVANGVMGQAMYRTTLENSYVEPSILVEMIPSSLVSPFIKEYSFMTSDHGSTISVTGVRVTFSEAIDASTFTTNDVLSVRVDPVLPFGSPYTIAASEVVAGPDGRQFDILFPPVSFHAGSVEVVIGHDIRDLHGDLMDHDQDRNPGEVTQDRARLRFRHWPSAIPEAIDIDPAIVSPRYLLNLPPEYFTTVRVPIPDYGAAPTQQPGTTPPLTGRQISDAVLAERAGDVSPAASSRIQVTQSTPATNLNTVHGTTRTLGRPTDPARSEGEHDIRTEKVSARVVSRPTRLRARTSVRRLR